MTHSLSLLKKGVNVIQLVLILKEKKRRVVKSF